MNLAIDIGNTAVKLGIFAGEQLVEMHPGENVINRIFKKHKIENVILSITGNHPSIENFLQKNGVSYLTLSYRLKLPIKILYETPDTLGADRIAGSVAANGLFRNQPMLKIDFGTCITYDFIDGKNQYHGGAISPGMAMRFKALNHYTTGLPLVDPPADNSYELTGANTNSGIISGVVNGIKEEVEGVIKQYELRFGNLKVVGTGGDMDFFGALLKKEIFVRPYLVLEGLNIILNYNS